jgi:hypothetical protein
VVPEITTDTRGTISLVAAETANLALWTGRLAYADPCWTPALGPSHRTRTPEALAPEPHDLPDHRRGRAPGQRDPDTDRRSRPKQDLRRRRGRAAACTYLQPPR